MKVRGRVGGRVSVRVRVGVGVRVGVTISVHAPATRQPRLRTRPIASARSSLASVRSCA